MVGSAAREPLPTVTEKSMLIGNPRIRTLASVGRPARWAWVVWYWGSRDMKDPHHLSMSRAERNADLIEECSDGRCRTRHHSRSVPAPGPSKQSEQSE